MTAALPTRVAPLPADQWDPADCRALWIAALEMYLRDVTAGFKGSQARHAQEALDDLLGRQVMLTQLCDPVGLNADAVAEAILSRLE